MSTTTEQTSTPGAWSWLPRPWRASLALVLAAVLGFGGWSTYAYWSDVAAVTTGSFSSGRLDLRLDGESASGLGTGYTKTAMTLSAMLPGESQAYPLIINNGGNPAVTYTMTVVGGPTWTFTAGALQLRAFAGDSLTNNATSPPRSGTCNGTALGALTPVPLPTGTAAALLTAPRELAADTTETVCLVVTMPTTVDNANQGRTGTMTITVTANQKT